MPLTIFSDQLNFAALFEAAISSAIPPRAKLALAVSGGGDSMALLDLAIAARAGADFDLVCLSVDHNLRDGSAAEVQQVADYCAAHQVTHQTLLWTIPSKTNLQERARDARYSLLIEAAQAVDADFLITAHTADDQAETVFARSTRGDGTGGLAGMWPSRPVAAGAGAPMPLVRPFLPLRREALRHYLSAHGVPFVDDPANQDLAFERIRHRQHLAGLDAVGEGLVETLCQTAEITRQLEQGIPLAGFVAAAELQFTDLGGAQFDRSGFLDLPKPAQHHFLRRVIYAVGGAAYAPAPGAAEEGCVAIRDNTHFALGGCIIKVGSTVACFREPAGLLGRKDGTSAMTSLSVARQKNVLWDRRARIILPEDIRDKSSNISSLMAEFNVQPKNWMCLAGVPALYLGNEIIAVPAAAIQYMQKFPVKADLPPWNAGPHGLHVEWLLQERLVGEVVRFSGALRTLG